MFWKTFLIIDNQCVHQLLVETIRQFGSVVKHKFLDFHQGVGDFFCNVCDSLHRLCMLHWRNHNVLSHKCDPTITITSIHDLCHDTRLRRISTCKQPSPLYICSVSHLCNTSIGDLHICCLRTGSLASSRVVTHFTAMRATSGHREWFCLCSFVFDVYCHSKFFPIQFFREPPKFETQ